MEPISANGVAEASTGKEPEMQREQTRQGPQLRLLDGGLDFEIIDCDNSVRVALSGSFDSAQLNSIIKLIKPYLLQRSRKIILDGSRLEHVDFRVMNSLTVWNSKLRSFGHTLFLSTWSSRHKAILLIGDTAATKPQRQYV